MKRNRINRPRFNLKEPKAKTSFVYLIFILPNRKRFKYSTGKKVVVKYWDKSTGFVKESLKYVEGQEINLYLRTLQNQFIEILKLYPDLEPAKIKQKLDKFNGLTVDRQIAESTLIDFADQYIKTCLLYTSPSPRDQRGSRMPSSA